MNGDWDGIQSQSPFLFPLKAKLEINLRRELMIGWDESPPQRMEVPSTGSGRRLRTLPKARKGFHELSRDFSPAEPDNLITEN